MNFINLPIFILFFAFVYLSIIYGLLKIAETQKQSENMMTDNAQEASQLVQTSRIDF